MKIILDTNILLLPAQEAIDIFSEIERVIHEKYELAIVKKSVNELEKIAQGNSKDARAARLGLQLINHKNINIIDEQQGYADDTIAALANNQTIVITQDQGLKKRVKNKGSRVFTFKQKKHLVEA